MEASPQGRSPARHQMPPHFAIALPTIMSYCTFRLKSTITDLERVGKYNNDGTQ